MSVVLTTLGYVIVGVIGYFGTKAMARAARQGTSDTARTTEQGQVLEAWKDLVTPLREQNESQQRQINELTRKDADKQVQIDAHSDQMRALRTELERWKNAARTLARWGITMRDQLRASGNTVPAEPDELAMLQLLSEAPHEDDH